MKRETMKNFDELLKQVGEFGRYQKLLYLLLCLPGIFSGFQVINTLIFLFAVPKHRCSIPGLENDAYEIQNAAHEVLVNLTIPRVSGRYGEEEYSPCEIYTSTNTSDVWSADVSNTTLSCTKWVYDRSQFISTVAQSFNLVCKRKPLVSVGKMMVMLGQFISAIYNGPLSDTFGRRPVIIVNVFFMVLTSIAMTWVDSVALMFVLEIFAYQFTVGQYITSFVFGMELVAPSKRMWTGITMNLFWSAANFIITLEAYLWRDWRTRQLIASIPGILCAYVYFLPESPRWLLDNGKVEEAKLILTRIAKGNKKEVDPDLFEGLTVREEQFKKEPFWNLFKSKILLRRILVICYCWFAISMSFYGLSMNATNLSGDIYLNFFLFALIELFAFILCYVLIDRMGRKKLLCTFLLGTGAACILPLISVLASDTPNPWVINSLAIIGNTFASINFAVVFTFTSELMPTSVRNSAMSLGSLSGRTGNLIAPYIVDLTLHGRYGQILPMMTFGGICALAGFLSFYLPETMNKRLPDTIKEAEKLGTAAYDRDVSEEEEMPCLTTDQADIQETPITSTC